MTLQARTARRKPTNKAGIIKADGKEYTVVLRDASESGARLRVIGKAEAPDRFRLIAPMEKIEADCVVVWRRGYDCGVRFE